MYCAALVARKLPQFESPDYGIPSNFVVKLNPLKVETFKYLLVKIQ